MEKMPTDDRKPFSGGLAILQIQPVAQPDLKPVLKLEDNFSNSFIIPKIKADFNDKSPILKPVLSIPDVKPKLEPFTGNVKSLSIRSISEIPDIKPLRRLKKFNCDMCQKGVGTKGGLIYHMKAHINGRPFKCDICKRSYSTKNDFDTHNKRHSGKVFTCDFCEKIFSTKHNAADHISAMHLPKVLKCEYCKKDKYFSAVKALRIHQMTCHFIALSGQTTVFMCKMCGYKTVSRIHFESHELKSKKMGHKCEICHQSFSCYKLLHEHRKTEKKMLVKCKKCKRYFKNIRYHMTKFHSKTKVCEVCQFKSRNRSKFYCHVMKCASQDVLRSKGHLCIECDKYFYSKSSLEIHASSKHGTFTCPICPYRCNQRKAFTNHKLQHKKNPIRCLCPKFPMFPNMQAFNSHFNPNHSTIRLTKAYFGVCLICWESRKKKVACESKSELEKHMLLHFERQPIITID